MRPHALDDADDLGAGLHDDPAAAMLTADEVLRVRLLVEVHLVAVTVRLAVRSCRRHGTAPIPILTRWDGAAPALTRSLGLAPARTPPRWVEAHHEQVAQALRLVARVQEDRVRAPPASLLRAEGVEPREHRVGRARRCRRACVVRAWTLRATARSMRIRLPSVSKHRLHERADAGWVIRDRRSDTR